MAIKDPDIRNTREWSYLDDETCFDLWNKFGNPRRAARYLGDQGLLNPDMKTPPTGAGVYVAALRYMVWNIEEAHRRIIDEGGDWALDRFKYLKWVLERGNRQSNLMGVKLRKKFNDDILDFAVKFLDPDDYERFLEIYYAELGDCPEGEDCDEEEPVPA